MATYNTVVLAKRPKGDIKAGETFKLKPEKRIEESDLEDGQVLVETRYLSLDPAMRGWLNGRTFFLAPSGALQIKGRDCLKFLCVARDLDAFFFCG